MKSNCPSSIFFIHGVPGNGGREEKQAGRRFWDSIQGSGKSGQTTWQLFCTGYEWERKGTAIKKKALFNRCISQYQKVSKMGAIHLLCLLKKIQTTKGLTLKVGENYELVSIITRSQSLLIKPRSLSPTGDISEVSVSYSKNENHN